MANYFKDSSPSTARREAAYSTTELLVVIVIALAATTVAIPKMLTVTASAGLRGDIASISGLFQNCRMSAVKNNRTMATHFRTASQGIIAFIKLSSDTSDPVTADPQVQLEAPIVQYTSPS